ncbi:MAG: serine/threonine protein kinase [Proteobacteria bacterium]|nr:serine/threonine protein kinase [Pseudomonadota bacterium]
MIDPKQWPELSRLLDEALELAPAERDRWLASLAPADLVHREELRSLLRHDDAAETSDFLSILPGVQTAAARARAAIGVFPISPGSTVGPYRIEREIGSGGMGVVWLARRSDGVIKRPVALKLPHAETFGRQLAERFESERDILAELVHPNIARLYDAGFCANGQPYLALEYVAGSPITAYCDEHSLDMRQRLQLFQQVLRAIQYAHGNLIIHRDLKPKNVIVGAGRRAVLLDFGIAKLISADVPGESAAGKAHEHPFALTPEYASPEQIAGEAITTASDIYSLGVLLYELLTGECPYNLGASSREALEQAIRTLAPVSPSRALKESAARVRGSNVKNLSRALRGDLDAIILKALKKAPCDRYRTADAFSEDIERYLAGEPVAARSGGGWYRTSKFIVRHNISVAVGAVALVAVVTTAAVTLLQSHSVAAHARAAAAERDRALAMSSRNAAVGEFVHMFITEAARSNTPVAPGDLVARTETIVNKEFQDSPDDRAAVLDVLSGYYDSKEEYEHAESLLQQALDITRHSGDADLRRKLACNHAASMAKIGKTTEAVRILNAALQDPQISLQQSASCMISLSRIAQAAGDGPTALQYAGLALQRLRQSEPHPPQALEGEFLADLGASYYLTGRNDLAAQQFSQAIAAMTRAGLDKSLDALAMRNNWAMVSDGAGTPRVALELLEQVLQLEALSEPGTSPEPAFLHNRALNLEYLGRFREAHESYLRCVSESRRTGAHGTTTLCFVGLASVALELGDTQAAGGYLADAATNMSAEVTPNPRDLMRLQIIRGEFALRQGRLAAARSDLDAAIVSGTNVYWKARALLIRSETNLTDNRLDAAAADARLALSLAQSAQGSTPYSNRTGLAWLMLGRVLAKRGDNDGARAAFLSAAHNLSNTVDADHPQLVLARRLSTLWQ